MNTILVIITIWVAREIWHYYKRYRLDRDLQKTVYALGYTYDELMLANQDCDKYIADSVFQAQLLEDITGVYYSGKVA